MHLNNNFRSNKQGTIWEGVGCGRGVWLQCLEGKFRGGFDQIPPNLKRPVDPKELDNVVEPIHKMIYQTLFS